MSYHLKIYINLKKLPVNSRSNSIAHFLPDDLTAHPLTSDVSVCHSHYYFDSVESIFLASEQEFGRFIAKLKHVIRYSIWQPDAYEPGPFRDLLWPGEFLKRTSITGLLQSFDEWDSRIRELNDINFYKVYCTLRKTLRRFLEVALSTETLILGEIHRTEGLETLENAIEHPFANVEVDLEGKDYNEPDLVGYIFHDRFADRHLI